MTSTLTARPSLKNGLPRSLWILATLGVIVVILFGVPWYFLFLAGSQWPPLAVMIGTAVFVVAMLAFLPLMYFGHRRDRDWAARIGDSIFGAVWVLFVWSILANLLRLALWLGGIDEPIRSRVVVAAIVVVCALLMLWGYIEALRVPRIKRVNVAIQNLPAALSGLRIVQLSDIHYGPRDRTRWSMQMVAAINTLNADIVCITGDIADGSARRREKQVATLGAVKARMARVYIPGNHEHYSDAQAWLDYMQALGWEPLRNRHIVIQRNGGALTVAGVEDASAAARGDADIETALAGANENQATVLLAHQPKQIKTAVDHGIDLQLSGHTHGGQIWPFGLLVRLDQPSVHGLTRQGTKTQLYTSRGTGYWGPPLRIFAPSEITALTLVSGD